jgi:Cu/Ag efflux pump CusA
MVVTGIRTPVGIKVFEPDLKELERIGREVERVLRHHHRIWRQRLISSAH